MKVLGIVGALILNLASPETFASVTVELKSERTFAILKGEEATQLFDSLTGISPHPDSGGKELPLTQGAEQLTISCIPKRSNATPDYMECKVGVNVLPAGDASSVTANLSPQDSAELDAIFEPTDMSVSGNLVTKQFKGGAKLFITCTRIEPEEKKEEEQPTQKELPSVLDDDDEEEEEPAKKKATEGASCSVDIYLS